MHLKTKNTIQRFLSFFLGLIFMTSGIGKLTKLPGFIGPNHLIEELTKYDLGLYGIFIAYAQVCIGFLLLTNRFRTLGAVMLLPLLANIQIIVISLDWSGTPYVVAFLLLLNIILLLLDYHKLKFILDDTAPTAIKKIQPARANKMRDIYYLLPFVTILIGCALGQSDEGQFITKIGVWLTLLSLLTFNIMDYRKQKKVEE